MSWPKPPRISWQPPACRRKRSCSARATIAVVCAWASPPQFFVGWAVPTTKHLVGTAHPTLTHSLNLPLRNVSLSLIKIRLPETTGYANVPLLGDFVARKLFELGRAVQRRQAAPRESTRRARFPHRQRCHIPRCLPCPHRVPLCLLCPAMARRAEWLAAPQFGRLAARSRPSRRYLP